MTPEPEPLADRIDRVLDVQRAAHHAVLALLDPHVSLRMDRAVCRAIEDAEWVCNEVTAHLLDAQGLAAAGE